MLQQKNDIASLQNPIHKINFRIISSTSSDNNYKATQLQEQSPESKGWQSQRFCTYPQILIIQLAYPSIVQKLTFLSHQSKITTQIDIQAREHQTASWKKLGYTCMQSNMTTNYNSRELRTVKLSKQIIRLLRFTLHHNYVNSINIFNQVGLIAIGVYGERYNIQPMDNINRKAVLKPGATLDKQTLDKLRQLQYMKREAINSNDFDKASQIKQQIQKLMSGIQALAILQKQKREAIKREDYQQAKKIYQKMKRIRGPIPRVVVSSNDRYDGQNVINQYERNKSTYTPVVHNNKMNFKNKSISYENSSGNPNIQPSSPIQQLKKSQKVSPKNKLNSKAKKPQPLVNFDQIPIKVNNNNRNIFEANNEDSQEQIFKKPSPKNVNQGKFQRNRVQLDKSANFQKPNIQQEQQGQQKPFQCNQYFSAIPQIIWDNIFSKDKNLRQHGLQQVQKIVYSLQNEQYLQKLFINAVILIVRYRITDKIVSVLLKVIDLLGITFKQYKPKAQQISKQSQKNLKFILNKLTEYLGHVNEKLKSEAQDVYIVLPKFCPKVITKELCIQTITLTQQVDRIPRSIIAKLEMLGKLILKYDKNSLNQENRNKATKEKYQDVIEFAKRYLQDRNSEVRATAVKLLALIGKIIGKDQLMKTLEDVRQITLKTIQQKLFNYGSQQSKQGQNQNIKKSSPPPKILSPSQRIMSPKKSQKNLLNNSQDYTQQNKVNQKKPQSPIKKSPVQNKKSIPNIQQQPVGPKKPQKPISPLKNPQYYCQYCQLFDKRLENQNFRDIHWFKDCPMITICPQCSQCIEIEFYNQHLLQECQKKKFFKRCPRCKQAINLKQFNKHVQSKICAVSKPLNIANRCPLCHQDVQPKKKGLLKHLKQQGCPCLKDRKS